MCTDVLAQLAQSEAIDGVVVVTRDPDAAALATEFGASVAEDHSGSHSAAALEGIALALTRGATRVLLVAGDCPTLTAGEIDWLLSHDQSADPSVFVFPDRHGAGTNALLLTPPDVIEPAFGPGSRERHIGLARASGAQVTVERLRAIELDVDTPEDLQEVATALKTAAPLSLAPRTRGALAEIEF